tara:strand:- start:54 stop:2324 length:2271 start_codon:yes stop_codon:yes gene_type:complete
MKINKALPIYAIIFSIFLFFLQHISQLPPQAKNIDSPPEVFSAERAYETLKFLLKENKPHPVGSDLNKVIKDRLIDELEKLDIRYEVQKTWACASRYAGCAEVENLIGIIPGKTKAPYLALMAHYDSVPMASGAGDDGAGVVAILEAARVLQLEAPYDHPIMLLLTDAEESGLIGAEAFFNQHPLAKEVGAVLNIEGSGTAGGSMVFRTSEKNELLIKSLSHEHDHAYGFSLANEIFKRMPNDTDFSVAMRANIPGMDFAFVGERNHYHTPNDNVENLDIRTIQHHGENILSASRDLLSKDWNTVGDKYVYLGGTYGFWSQWKASNSLIALILSTLVLIGAFVRSKIKLKRLTQGFILSSITLVTTISSGFLCFYLLSVFSGNVISWPGIDWPYRILLIGSTSLGLLVGCSISRKFLQELEMVYGAWFFWALLTLVVTLFLPDAANLFILPLVFGSLILLISNFLKEQYRLSFLLLTLVIALPSTLGLIFSLEQSQGYKLVLAVLPFVGLYAILISPFLFSVNMKTTFSVVGLITLMAITTGSTLNLYTEMRPQHVNIHFYENLDTKKSFVHLSGNYKNVAASDPEPLIEPLASYVDIENTKAIASYAPEYKFRYWAESISSEWKEPSIAIKARTKNIDSMAVTLKSNRNASRIILLLPEASKLKSFNIGSQTINVSPSTSGPFKGYYSIYLNGVYDKQIDLILNFENYTKKTKGYLMDISTKLPGHLDEIYQARSGIFSPVHRGDQAILIKTVTI